jgi:2-polyprenyl-3-methyl-5-hydroxy-6-metoxy-1,4-benzoquinol methylase
MTLEHYYGEKEREYFTRDRQDILQIIPPGPPGRILEIGAADGNVLVDLKRSGRAREVVGVELFPSPDGSQSRSEIDRFIIADVEKKELDLEPQSFDTLICADVLEHLRDPWGILRYLTGFLRDGGVLVLSLPNILYWRAFGRILSGDFHYCSSGVLDKTHLRFFCRRNMLELVRSAGLTVTTVEPSFRRQAELRRDRLLNVLTLGLAERHLTQQYLIVAVKSVSRPGRPPRSA